MTTEVSSGSARHRLTPPSRPLLLPLALTGVALLLWLWGVNRVRLNDMSDSGLISILGWQVLLSYPVLAAASALALRREAVSNQLLAVQVMLLVLMVHGLPALIEPQAGYFTAYLHVGFVEEITRTGQTIPSLDARFSWPGSFGLGGLIAAVGGVDTARYYLRWAPVLFNLGYLAPLRMIAKAVTRSERARWLGMWIFVAANWLHQDYYSPQAVNFFLYLVILAVILRWFGHGEPIGVGAAWRARLAEWASADRDSGSVATDPPSVRGPLILVLVLLLATVVVSHQITPVALLLTITALVVLGRCSLRHLSVVLALLFAGWFAVGAAGFWKGHLSVLTGGAGDLGQNLGSSLFGRVNGSTARVWVLRLRIGLTVAMLGVAALGWLRRTRKGAPPVALTAIAVLPFAMVVGQAYGGEVLLRSYLFALPAVCILAAIALGEHAGVLASRSWVVIAAVALTVVAVTGVTARFGNEQFEQVGTNDLAAVQWVYRNAPVGATLIAPARDLPWRFQQIEGYRYRPDDEAPITTVGEVMQFVRDDEPTYLLTSDEQQLFGEQLYGSSPHWLDDLRSDLVATGRLTQVFVDGDARVYRIAPPGKGQP